MPEHKPITDEELVEFEHRAAVDTEALFKHETVERLVAEVRRLGIVADMAIDEVNKARATIDQQSDTIGDLGNMINIERRTLTLPNGTEVEWTRTPPTEPGWYFVVLEYNGFAVTLDRFQAGKWERDSAHNPGLIVARSLKPLSLPEWSSVYPDRPVPGVCCRCEKTATKSCDRCRELVCDECSTTGMAGRLCYGCDE